MSDRLWAAFREEHGPRPMGRGAQARWEQAWLDYQQEHRNDTIEEDGRKFVSCTPTWAEILPTWKRLMADAYGPAVHDKLEAVENFWTEMQRMAEAADKWNAHSKLITLVDDAHERAAD